MDHGTSTASRPPPAAALAGTGYLGPLPLGMFGHSPRAKRWVPVGISPLMVFAAVLPMVSSATFSSALSAAARSGSRLTSRSASSALTTGGQRVAEPHPLGLTAGQPIGPSVGYLGDPRHRQHLAGRQRRWCQSTHQLDQFPDRHPAEQPAALQHRADMAGRAGLLRG